jgi:acyl-CoA reductase-like NAD-dependent aldehyde dehydrogenase
VLVKAHAAHPGTSELAGTAIAEAVRELGLPPGVFSLLFDDGFTVGASLVRHPLVKAVAFTGSRRGGLALAALAATRPVPIPIFAEMGSINPIFILPGALQARAAEIASGLVNSVTLGVGQFCTNPGLVVIERGPSASEFSAQLVRQMAMVTPGTMLATSICRSYHEGIERLSTTPGVRTLAKVASETKTSGGAALFATDASTWLENPALAEEVFGPCTLLVECASPAEMQTVAEALEGQLTATLHATPAEQSRCGALLTVLEQKAGRIGFNNFPTGVEVCDAMIHGGPFPATLDGHSTSVGGRALHRFARPVCYQGFPPEWLPPELRVTVG